MFIKIMSKHLNKVIALFPLFNPFDNAQGSPSAIISGSALF
jgi:hypothetical protein